MSILLRGRKQLAYEVRLKMSSNKEAINSILDGNITDKDGNITEDFYIVHISRELRNDELENFNKVYKNPAAVFIRSIVEEPIIVRIDKEMYIMLMRALYWE